MEVPVFKFATRVFVTAKRPRRNAIMIFIFFSASAYAQVGTKIFAI